MTWLDRIRGRSAPAAETRDGGFAELSRALAEAYGGSSGPVSPTQAERLAAVAACVALIAGSIASLPASIIMQDGKPAPPTTPALRILKRPNAMQSWPSFVGQGVRSLLLTGNFLARVDEDGRGAAIGATTVPWAWCTPRVLTGGGGARLAYDIENRSSEALLLGLPARLLSDEAMHCRLGSDDGIVGRSAIGRAGAAVREGLTLQDAASATWKNGMRPSAVLSAPAYLTDAQRNRYETDLKDKFAGAVNSGGMPLLEGGWKLETISMKSTDAQFIENRALNIEAVCGLFNVPSILVRPGERTPADLAPYIAAFAQLALLPIVTAIAHEFNHSVLGNGELTLELDLDGMSRGSFSAVVAALAALKQSAIITGNDARAELGWPPVAEGNELGIAAAPSWPADATGMPHLGPSPGPRGNGPAEPNTHANKGAA